MRMVFCLVLISSCMALSGCMSAHPIMMDNGIQRKVITRCDNDVFCFRKPVYDITWDSWCQQSGCGNYKSTCSTRNHNYRGDYPVSYRSNEYVYANDPHGYAVTLPAGGNIRMQQEKPTEVTYE